ncbi:MAG: TRAP transporter small permease subunit [Pseudomonadota bacterium]
MSLWSDIGTIIGAFLSQDSWEIREALKSNAAWWLGTAAALILGTLIVGIYRAVPFVERHLERTIMVVSYLAVAFIIFWGVIDRFVFSNQQPWSTTVPPLLFMIMAWFGASYNVRLRTHLSFSEFRARMPRMGQFLCLCLDTVLWLGFAIIVFVTTTRLVALSASNFQIVLGTDNVQQWWFLVTAPLAFLLMTARVLQNFFEDVANLRSGAPLVRQTVIGGEAE